MYYILEVGRMKTCTKCGETKDITLFHNDKSRPDSKHPWCKECNAQDAKTRRAVNPEETRRLGRAYLRKFRNRRPTRRRKSDAEYRASAKGRASNAKSAEKHYARFPEKRRAKDAVSNAVKRGDLVRPTTCSICDMERGLIQGHHVSYAAIHRLAVVWCCRTCHRVIHSLTGTRNILDKETRRNMVVGV